MSAKSDLDEIKDTENLSELSKAIESLRKKGLLNPDNIVKIQDIIDTKYPASLRAVAKSLLEEDEKDEKEEKINLMHPQNICSNNKDLFGEPISKTFDETLIFLLPKTRKSECLTESDLNNAISKRTNEIYLYDQNKKHVIKSAPVYRLPSSGIWIIGNPIYLRLFRAYKLESFGKHIISAETHLISSIWRQEHELYRVEPVHWKDFTSYIQDDAKIPDTGKVCACMFRPREEDWSAAALSSFPTGECQWMVPTWNGAPVLFGEECGNLLSWDWTKMKIPSQIKPESEPVLKKPFAEIQRLIFRIMNNSNSSEIKMKNGDVTNFKITKVNWKWETGETTKQKEMLLKTKQLRRWPSFLNFEIDAFDDINENNPPTYILVDDEPVLKIDKWEHIGSSSNKLLLAWKIKIVGPTPW